MNGNAEKKQVFDSILLYRDLEIFCPEFLMPLEHSRMIVSYCIAQARHI